MASFILSLGVSYSTGDFSSDFNLGFTKAMASHSASLSEY
jgi:hypothetical protein